MLLALVLALALTAGFACGCNRSYSASYSWVLNTIIQNYYEDIPVEELHKSIISGGVSSVLDKYSAYYTSEEYRQITASNSGNKIGIGITYQWVDEGVSSRGSGALVTCVSCGSPAWESGLKAGTFISGVRLDEEETQLTCKEDFSSFITERAEEESFTLVTDRGDYEVARQQYISGYCTMSTSHTTYSIYYRDGNMLISEEEGIALLPEGAAYLRLDQFYGNAVEEFSALMEKYNDDNCTSLILDLRQNGGGYVNVMCGISGIFTGQSGINAMTAEYKGGKRETFNVSLTPDSRNAFPKGAQLSVLADNGTASASEALIGVLISYDVIDYSDIYISDFSPEYLSFSGTQDKNCRTYGKGIMQTTFTNRATGEALKLTTAKLYWPNGTCIHDVGLTAEKCNTVKTDWCVTYGDEQLARAINMIYG